MLILTIAAGGPLHTDLSSCWFYQEHQHPHLNIATSRCPWTLLWIGKLGGSIFFVPCLEFTFDTTSLVYGLQDVLSRQRSSCLDNSKCDVEHLLVQVKWLHATKKGCHPRAFHDACTNGHVEVADWLHGNCSACQERTKNQPSSPMLTFLGLWSGSGPYFGARWASFPPPAPLGMKMLKWLLEKYDLADALYHLLANAVIAGDEECFEFLMSQPEEFHQAARQSPSRVPPLMELAVKYGRVDMLPALSKITGTIILVRKMLNLLLT